MFTAIDLCLLCFTNHTNLKNILSKDSDGEIVKEKLKCFLSKHIEIEPEDSMLYICLPCLEKLNDVYNYKRLCLWNINRFSSFIQKLKSTDGTYSNLQVTLIDIKNINMNEITCGNELNNESITTEIIDIDNGTIKKEPNENETKLEVFGEILEQENEIKYALVDEIVKEETEDNYDVIEVKSELYNDAFLNVTDNNEEPALQEENLVEHEYEFVDDNVKEKSEDNNSDIIDIQLELENDAVFDETGDNEESTSKIDPEPSATELNLNDHEQSKDSDRPFKCYVCNKKFTLKSSLKRHLLIHTGERPHKCDICDKAFVRNGDLVSHKRCHTGEKPYKCDVCAKAFNQKFNLVRHIRSHTKEKPYKCDVCAKAFNHKFNLVMHIRGHTGEKPYKCDVCDKAFDI